MAIPPHQSDRRPIAARQTRWASAVTAWLVRRRISPNAISIWGMVFCCLAGAVLAVTPFLENRWAFCLAWLAAALLVQLRLLANLFDGMVAIAAGTASKVGELYNDLPDRFSDMATLIGLGYAAGGSPELGYLAALAAVMTAYVRVLGKASGTPYDFAGPMAKQHRMALVTATCVACAILPTAWTVEVRLPAIVLGVILAGSCVTILRRLIRVARTLRARPGI
jgi:phosphatidylglycerophosphate synthase